MVRLVTRTPITPEGAVKAVDPSVRPEQMTVLEATDPFIIKGEKPTQRDYNYFTNDSEDMFVGMWDSEPFQSEMKPFPCYELVQLLEGNVTITEEGRIGNPLFRFMARFVFGYSGTIESYLRALAARYGEEARITAA